jgi:hypothetical protein
MLRMPLTALSRAVKPARPAQTTLYVTDARRVVLAARWQAAQTASTTPSLPPLRRAARRTSNAVNRANADNDAPQARIEWASASQVSSVSGERSKAAARAGIGPRALGTSTRGQATPAGAACPY